MDICGAPTINRTYSRCVQCKAYSRPKLIYSLIHRKWAKNWTVLKACRSCNSFYDDREKLSDYQTVHFLKFELAV